MKRLVGIGLFLCGYCWSVCAQNAAMFGGDQQHTGVYFTVGKAKLQKERWRFKTGNVNPNGNWNALKRRDVRLSQSPAAVSLSQLSPG